MKEPFDIKVAIRYFLVFLAVTILFFPYLNTYAFPKNDFVTDPRNGPYERMALAVTTSLSVTNFISIILTSWNSASLRDFQLIYSISCASLSFYNKMYGIGAFWIVLSTIIFVSRIIFFRFDYPKYFFGDIKQDLLNYRKEGHPLWSKVTLSIFYCLFGLGFILGPTSAPWDPVAKFVRWLPLNIKDELVWRGIFLCSAILFFFAATAPFTRHRLFVLFLCISGFIHATTMLFDNRLSKEGNDNVEHLYGDILGWYLISIVSIVFGFVIPAISKPKEVSPQKPSEP